jgi:hypothetical protein
MPESHAYAIGFYSNSVSSWSSTSAERRKLLSEEIKAQIEEWVQLDKAHLQARIKASKSKHKAHTKKKPDDDDGSRRLLHSKKDDDDDDDEDKSATKKKNQPVSMKQTFPNRRGFSSMLATLRWSVVSFEG